MKQKQHLIIEKQKCWSIFMICKDIHSLCTLADLIEVRYAGCVTSIQYSNIAEQGIILIKKDDKIIRRDLEELLEEIP